MAPSFAQVPVSSVDAPRVTKRAPLASTGSLDRFEKVDVTTVIGTEFARGVQVADFLSSLHSDDLIRDLAILGVSCYSSMEG